MRSTIQWHHAKFTKDAIPKTLSGLPSYAAKNFSPASKRKLPEEKQNVSRETKKALENILEEEKIRICKHFQSNYKTTLDSHIQTCKWYVFVFKYSWRCSIHSSQHFFRQVIWRLLCLVRVKGSPIRIKMDS